MMNRRIILCGPTCSGKTFLRNRFENRGFTCDISYTSRKPRDGEKDGVHYKFLEKKQFEVLVKGNFFYEWVEYDGKYYGTGKREWENLSLFIMETDGIKHIKPEDCKNSFIIYLNPPVSVRMLRMKERGWNSEKANKRLVTDQEKFGDFTDYDIIIRDENF